MRPGLTPGQPLATARGAVGFSTFLGAIYTLAGVEESFYCGEGKGATAVEVGENECCKEPWGESSTALPCTWLGWRPLLVLKAPSYHTGWPKLAQGMPGSSCSFPDGSGWECQLSQHLHPSWTRGEMCRGKRAHVSVGTVVCNKR